MNRTSPQVNDAPRDRVGALTDLGVLREIVGDTRPGTDGEDRMPLVPAMETLIGRRVKRGALLAVDGGVARLSLAVALLAGVSGEGGWCGIVGLPEFGFAGARTLGLRTETVVAVEEPGARWTDALGALLAAADAVVVRPPEGVPGRLARRLARKARESRCALVTLGAAWEGTDVRVSAIRQEWLGLGPGHGHLRARRVTAVASTRPEAEVDLWLPGEGGEVRVGEVRVGTARLPTAALSGEPISPAV